MEFYQESRETISKHFGTNPETGLRAAHVEELRQVYGRNELRQEKKTPWYAVFARQYKSTLMYILFGAALVSALSQDWLELGVILFILIINGCIGTWQELKTQGNIDALKKMAKTKATVLRDGKQLLIPAEELVPGDIIILQTGDKIPADARLIETAALETQEGALTGESTPVVKSTETLTGNLTLADRKNMVFSGTVITKGRGKAIVVTTGMKTEIGKIAHLIQESDSQITPLQKELDLLATKLGRIVLGLCGIVFIVFALSIRASTLQEYLHTFKHAIALAVAAIPEGLPVVVTIALAFGTQRMLKKNALIKRLASVESLGSTTVICTDKTGTLTKNEMTITRIYHHGDIEVTGTGYNANGSVQGNIPLIMYEIGALCNDAELTGETQETTVIGDPTEGCLLTLARKGGHDEKHLRKSFPRVAEIPFTSERKRMTTIHDMGKARLALIKGAPDILLQQCSKIQHGDHVRTITDKDRKEILEANERYASEALRVLGFAYKTVPKHGPYNEDLEEELTFVGLVGMIDPPREEAIRAVGVCKEAGIRVVMITGDHKATAMAIAKQLGIEGKAVEGKDLKDINLEEEVQEISIYARVNPEHKMQIIEALQKRGEVVAMTGDGVNDAPAIKRADIGIAMGITGTDVAKESSAMILTDDNFSSIVSAVEEGRNIYNNIKKFVAYLLSSNLAEILVVLGSIVLFTYVTAAGEVLPAIALTIIMILFVNICTDGLPALALGVEPGNPDVMKKPPRRPDQHIINKNMLLNIIIIGIMVAIATLGVFRYAYGGMTGTPETLIYAQTMALTTQVVLEFVRLAMIRRQYHTKFFSNKWLGLAVIGVIIIQVSVIYVPWLQTLIGTTALHILDWAVIAGVAIVTYVLGMMVGSIVQRVTGQEN